MVYRIAKNMPNLPVYINGKQNNESSEVCGHLLPEVPLTYIIEPFDQAS